MNDNEPSYIIVIGASAGGLEALKRLVKTLPENLDATFFIVMHLSRYSLPEIIRHQLEKSGPYDCRIATDNSPINKGVIYIAPADQHLLIKQGLMRLTRGPHENRYRPSIDALFRSAAAGYDSRVIGIILSGMLDDGTSGMSAIKRSGGTCIVQEPAEAAFTGMPDNVLHNVDVDYKVPVADMGYILDDLCARTPGPGGPIPEDVKLEADITERMVSDIDTLAKLGTHSNFTCPDCGGGLWRMKNEASSRYRCHTGHVYTERMLAEKQNDALEESLWVSIRMMEERRNLLLTMFGQADADTDMASNQKGRADELDIHIERLKQLLVNINQERTPPDEGYL